MDYTWDYACNLLSVYRKRPSVPLGRTIVQYVDEAKEAESGEFVRRDFFALNGMRRTELLEGKAIRAGSTVTVYAKNTKVGKMLRKDTPKPATEEVVHKFVEMNPQEKAESDEGLVAPKTLHPKRPNIVAEHTPAEQEDKPKANVEEKPTKKIYPLRTGIKNA